MSGIVAIGEEHLLRGYALAGATALPARDAAEARAAWDGLPADTAMVVLTPAAHAALADAVRELELLYVVLP